VSFYSDDDKFARGILGVVFIPVSIPQVIGDGGSSLILIIVMVCIFFLVLYLDWKIYLKLYNSGSSNQYFIITVFITAFFGFIFSFFIPGKSALLWAFGGWNLYLAIKASSIYKKLYKV